MRAALRSVPMPGVEWMHTSSQPASAQARRRVAIRACWIPRRRNSGSTLMLQKHATGTGRPSASGASGMSSMPPAPTMRRAAHAATLI